MKQTEWIVIFMLAVVCVYALQQGSSWQKSRYQKEQQEQIDEIKNAEVLFSSEWTYEEEMPEKTKKEACKASQACYILSQALVYEARGESYLGALAVASVIMNRADHPNFPNTIEGVIKQPYQFSYLADMSKQSTPARRDWDRALLIAYDVKHGVVERTTDALFYLNPKAVKRIPRWAREYQYVMTVDNHAFYKYN